MFRSKTPKRGIVTKDGIYCPHRNKTYSSEVKLEPRQFLNKPVVAHFICNWEHQRGIGRGRGFGRRYGLGGCWIGSHGRFF